MRRPPKKRPKRRSALGENALDLLLRPSGARGKRTRAAAEPVDVDEGENGKPVKVRTTFHLPEELVEKIRDACFWERLTLAGLAEDALRSALAALERKHGGPFPRRTRPLLGGRPIGS